MTGKDRSDPDDGGGRQTLSPMNNEIHRFEDLAVWQEGMQLAVQIHRAAAGWCDHSLKDHKIGILRRTGVSVVTGAEPQDLSDALQIHSGAKT